MSGRSLAAPLLMLGGILASEGVGAATITNREAEVRSITIVESGLSKEHVLKPAGKLENICRKGCIVRFGQAGAGEWELVGDELVSIEDGFLYYDPLDGRSAGESPSGRGGGNPDAPQK
jgi:hypothetical protein